MSANDIASPSSTSGETPKPKAVAQSLTPDQKTEMLRIIQKDSSLTPQEKIKKIHHILTGHVKIEQVANFSNSNLSFEALSPLEQETTYFQDNIMGCQHYSRNCKMFASCCGKFFTCRLCHDQNEEIGHEIDRYAVDTLLCMKCHEIQPVSNVCSNCSVRFAEYYCDVCHLWDSRSLQREQCSKPEDLPESEYLPSEGKRFVFHCEKCNLCRIGKGFGYDTYHCNKCNMCYSSDYDHGSSCPGVQIETCPFCHCSVKTCVEPVRILLCGHSYHEKCMTNMIDFWNSNSNSTPCPRCSICKRGFTIIDEHYRCIEIFSLQQKMPPSLLNTIIHILCNDCLEKTRTNYHFLFNRCEKCGSHNTQEISRVANQPPIDPENLFKPDPSTVERAIASILLRYPDFDTTLLPVTPERLAKIKEASANPAVMALLFSTRVDDPPPPIDELIETVANLTALAINSEAAETEPLETPPPENQNS